MQIPKPSPPSVKVFEELTPDAKNVSTKKVFGQPAAFVNGNLFFGVFGDQLFVRLSEDDRSEAKRGSGFNAFEPMPGRPMSEYLVLPRGVIESRDHARRWVTRSLEYASGLPGKKPKEKVK